MNNLFSYRNIAIAVVVVLFALIGYYTLKPKATAPAAKPAVTAPITPAAPDAKPATPAAPAKPAEPAKK